MLKRNKPLKRKPLKRGKPLKRSFIERKPRSQEEKEEQRKEIEKMNALFIEIWNERCNSEDECRCFETSVVIKGRGYKRNTCCYHHVLEKSQYPEYRYVKKNIIVIMPYVHELVHQDIDLTPKIKKYREYLLNLHTSNSLKDN